MTIVAENMTSKAVDRAIEDARKADMEIHIKDTNGKVFQNTLKTPKRGKEEELGKLDENSELELLSNLSSSTEIEQETKEHNLLRSKRLTKTNPIIRLNNTVTSDHRKFCQKTKPRGERKQRLSTTAEQACPGESYEDRTITSDATGETVAKQCLGRTTAPKETTNPQLVNSYPIMEGGMQSKKLLEDKLL